MQTVYNKKGRKNIEYKEDDLDYMLTKYNS